MAALTLDALLRSLKKGASLPDPVYLLHGDEDVLKDEAIRALVDQAVGSSRDFNLDVRFAPDLTPESFNALVNTPPMIADRRAVVIRGVEQLGKRKTKLRRGTEVPGIAESDHGACARRRSGRGARR